MARIYFPCNRLLEEAIMKALVQLDGKGTTKEINNKVIEILDLPEEVVTLEDESGLCTKLDYRLRWCRTELKNKGLITQEVKGTWLIK